MQEKNSHVGVQFFQMLSLLLQFLFKLKLYQDISQLGFQQKEGGGPGVVAVGWWGGVKITSFCFSCWRTKKSSDAFSRFVNASLGNPPPSAYEFPTNKEVGGFFFTQRLLRPDERIRCRLHLQRCTSGRQEAGPWRCGRECGREFGGALCFLNFGWTLLVMGCGLSKGTLGDDDLISLLS